MKRQVVVIHGGGTYDSYREYLADLRKSKLDRDDAIGRPAVKSWKDNLQKDLGSSYEVFVPEMPNWTNAKYIEWKIWFEKIIPHLKGEIVLIGHSLGGIFLARYLAENTFPERLSIRAVLLVAPPWNVQGSGKSFADFVLPRSMRKFEGYGEKIHLYQSKDDQIVAFSNVKRYEKALPCAVTHIFKDKGHFRTAKFPELVKNIKALYK